MIRFGPLPEVHRKAVVIDLHSDAPRRIVDGPSVAGASILEHEYLPRWRAGGVSGAILTVGGDAFRRGSEALIECVALIEGLLREMARFGDRIRLVGDPDEFEAAVSQGVFAAIMGLEGASALCGDLRILGALHRLGLRSLGLTWNFRNDLADGLTERGTGGGLTQFGCAVVNEANRLGIIIDVAHLSPAGVKDVLRVSRAPTLCTHANVRKLCDHPRNLSDDQIRAIAESGGLLGISFVPLFLRDNGKPTIRDVVDHMSYVVELVGPEHLAIGADYIESDPVAVARVMEASGFRTSANMPFPEGLQQHSDFPNLTSALLEAGWLEDDVIALLGGNFLRVWREVRVTASG